MAQVLGHRFGRIKNVCARERETVIVCVIDNVCVICRKKKCVCTYMIRCVSENERRQREKKSK